MMADGRLENIQIFFSDITESIDYIRKIAKQKPNKQSILSQLQKKEQYKDPVLSCLGEEIDTYLSTGKLYVNLRTVIPCLLVRMMILLQKIVKTTTI